MNNLKIVGKIIANPTAIRIVDVPNKIKRYESRNIPRDEHDMAIINKML